MLLKHFTDSRVFIRYFILRSIVRTTVPNDGCHPLKIDKETELLSVAAPEVWNRFPFYIKSFPSLDIFKCEIIALERNVV